MIADRLRCAQSAETAIQMTLQNHQKGLLLQWAGSPEIVVLQSDGVWQALSSTWRQGDANPSAGAPPAGAIAPTGAFGKAWFDSPETKAAVGWPVAEQKSVTGATQGFVGGRMLWTPDKMIYVLFADHTWRSFADEFTG